MLSFLGIGAQKAGTSWLFENLRAHPDVSFPAGKEVHYWDRLQQAGKQSDHASYVKLFAGHSFAGEITPAYATLSEEYLRQLHQLFPAARIIFIIRNPIDRAWSAARMYMEFCHLQPAETNDAWFETIFRSDGSLQRGDYESTIRLWRRYFKDQFQVMYFDDLQASPQHFLHATQDFLGLTRQGVAPNPVDVNQAVRVGVPLALSDHSRELLRALYAERIKSLSLYLGRDLKHWLV